jgi:hypothetical protein
MDSPPPVTLLESSFPRRRESRFVFCRISLDTRVRGYDGDELTLGFRHTGENRYLCPLAPLNASRRRYDESRGNVYEVTRATSSYSVDERMLMNTSW